MRFPCIVLMPRDSAQTWASRVRDRFETHVSRNILPKQSFLIEVFLAILFHSSNNGWNSYNFFFLRKTMALKKEIKHGTIKKETKNWYFILYSTRWDLYTRGFYFISILSSLCRISNTERYRVITCAVSNKASARSFCELRRELEPRPCDQSRQRPTRRDRNNAWWHAPPKENNTRVSCVIGRKGSNETPFMRAILFL